MAALPGQIVQADARSYCTAAGSHGGYPAVDAFAKRGTPIWAPYFGRAEPATYDLGGNACWFYVDADQGAPYRVLYLAHGQVRFGYGRFGQGEPIGAVGDTGNAAGNPHVHYAGGDSVEQISQRNGSGSFWFPSWTWGQGAAPVPVPIRPKRRVLVDGLRLRVSPGTTREATVLRELRAGTILEATVVDSHLWWRCRTEDGLIGWVAADEGFLEEV